MPYNQFILIQSFEMPKFFLATSHILSTLLLLIGLCSTASAVTLYKWTDADGNVSYQDQQPPPGQKYEEKSYSDQGANTQSNPDIDRSKAARENPVTLYVAPDCSSCDLARTVLDLHKIPYENVDVEENHIAQQQLIKIAGAVRVPSVTVGSEVITGFDRNRIEDALKLKGYPITRREDSSENASANRGEAAKPTRINRNAPQAIQ